jgi:hypothetical protein
VTDIEKQFLARRVMALPQFRWAAGMGFVRTGPRSPGERQTVADVYTGRDGQLWLRTGEGHDKNAGYDGMVPDLDAPGTWGALLAALVATDAPIAIHYHRLSATWCHDGDSAIDSHGSLGVVLAWALLAASEVKP